MGRPALPTELKRLRGNPGKRRLPKPMFAGEVTAEAPKPARPLGAVGKKAWQHIWQHAIWLSRVADIEIVTRLCEAYDERARYRKELRSGQLTIQGARGIVANPLIAVLRGVERQLTQWESLCGLTPSDRSRLGLSELKRRSALEEFLGDSD